jgi:hypothetical protein
MDDDGACLLAMGDGGLVDQQDNDWMGLEELEDS